MLMEKHFFLASSNKQLNSREHISYIFVDMTSAFDTVRHGNLFKMLECNGVRGIALRFRGSSYLKGENTFLARCDFNIEKDNNWCSLNTQIRTTVVPIVYINDLPSLSDLSNFTLFPDDTTVAIRYNNIEALSYNFNGALVLSNT